MRRIIKPNEFNDYFANIRNDISIPILHFRIIEQLVFKAVDESDVMQIILNLKSKSSTGYDMISNKLSTLIGDEL